MIPAAPAPAFPPRIEPLSEEHLPALAELAGTIWRACYPGIISAEQIDYMLARMYALDTMRDEIRSQSIRYDRLLADDEFAGFAAYGPGESVAVFKLHKLYLLPRWQGYGLGSFLLRHVEDVVRAAGARQLILNVNKCNTKAMAAYGRNGYRIADSVVADIGGGFVMDDFIMSKDLSAAKEVE